jgi:hypothetical protein
MAAPDPKLIAAGAAAFTAIVGGLVFGLYWAGEPPEPSARVTLGWEGTPGEPRAKRCIETVGLASQQALDLFRLASDGGMTAYVYTVLAVDADQVADAGEMVPLPEGMLAMEVQQREVDCPDAGWRFLAVLQGEPEWPCACSQGADCERLFGFPGMETWQPAPRGLTMDPGRWRGTDGGLGGCVPKTCIEFAGTDSMPEVCR